MDMIYSFIVPVYNRPREIKELLDSFMELQFDGDYEILIIEDGSDETSKDIVDNYPTLPISYYFKENSGPGDCQYHTILKKIRGQGNQGTME
jgi:glycosyltransferase involved in cell wall biosynthesis